MTEPAAADGARAPRHLDPAIIAFEHRLEHGALVRIGGAGPQPGADLLTGSQVLEFQYNPETITRVRNAAWESRRQRRSGTPPPQEARAERGGQGSGALNAESEQITFKLVFDATEAILAGRPGAADEGVLPELGFLEITVLGKERGPEAAPGAAAPAPARPGAAGGQAAGGAAGQRAQPVRPDELLLVLGRARTFPVVITGMTITEQKFLPTLVPVRAEVDLKLTVLEPGESAYSEWISKAFDDVVAERVRGAEVAHGHSALDAVSEALSGSLFRAPRARPTTAGTFP